MAAQFCRCGHNRSFHWTNAPHICREPRCECVKHDTAVMPKKAKLALVEPSPNAMARDAAVRVLRDVYARIVSSRVWGRREFEYTQEDIRAVIAQLEVIS